MTTFEREVLTMPAGGSYEFVKRHFVYTCPPPKRGRGNNYNFKPFLYLAVREGNGGRMEWLFKVVKRYILPKDMSEIKKLKIDSDDMCQIEAYWTDPEVIRFAADEYKDYEVVQFYVLDRNHSIRLKTPMKPMGRNWQGTRYLDLFDFFGTGKDVKLVPAHKE